MLKFAKYKFCVTVTQNITAWWNI